MSYQDALFDLEYAARSLKGKALEEKSLDEKRRFTVAYRDITEALRLARIHFYDVSDAQ